MTTPISFTVRPPNAPHRPSPLGNGGGRSGPPSRRFFEQNNGDEEDEEEDYDDRRDHRSRPKEERIEGFGKNGRALGYVFRTSSDRTETNRGEKVEGPMVIPSLPNRDWRAAAAAARRTPSYRPQERRADVEEDTKPDRIGDEPQKSGLSFVTKKEVVEDMGGVEVQREQEESVTINGNAQTTTTTSTTTVKSEPLDLDVKPMTLEEQALQAILNADHSTESEADRIQREMVIQSEADRLIQSVSETDALQRDLDELPEESTGDDYRNVPVEAFGMAMLRGMGWNPNDEKNTKIHQPKSRPGQLGLGATPMSEIIPPTHDKKSKREDRAKRGGRGFNASGLMLKKEINGSENGSGSRSGSATPAGSSSSRRPSPEYDSDASKRRRRDDDYDSRDSRRQDDRDRARGERYETEEERARRKAKERERDRDRGDRYETEDERARRKAKEKERDRDRRDYRDSDDRDRRR